MLQLERLEKDVAIVSQRKWITMTRMRWYPARRGMRRRPSVAERGVGLTFGERAADRCDGAFF